MASQMPFIVLSLMTSSLLLYMISSFSITVSDTPFVSFIFFSLLPTIVSINVILEGYGYELFIRHVWKKVSNVLIRNQCTQKQTPIHPIDKLTAARSELLKSINEHWLCPSQVSPSRSLGQSKQRPKSLMSSTSGSLLFEQVQGTLHDHVINETTPVYLMDLATGYFLRATQHRKLVFTLKPDTSCLFYLVQGKTHHWGLRSVVTQRYIGQNLVQKMVVASKKLHAWEAFRVLQRPEDQGVGYCSPQVYFILDASRFGKGMWLANKPGSMSFAHSAVPIRRSSGSSFYHDTEEEEGFATEHNYKRPQQRGLFLSKQFDHAIGFVYSSNLSSLIAAIPAAKSQSDSAPHFNANAPTTPCLINETQSKRTTFQTPMLARWDLGDVRLPWLDTVACANSDSERTPMFLELSEEEMTEVTTTAIRGSSVHEFLEMIAPRATRIKCKIDRTRLSESSPVDSSATALSKRSEAKSDTVDLLSVWHAHPNFGLVRAFSSDAGVLTSQQGIHSGITRKAGLNNVEAVTIEQYHCCTVDDDMLDEGTKRQLPHKAVLQFKIYSLNVPYSNCFSIEVLADIENVPVSQDDANEQRSSASDAASFAFSNKTMDDGSAECFECNSALKIRWRAGVVFSRKTMFKAQIERGALDGVRQACASISTLLKDESMSQRAASPYMRRQSLGDTNDATSLMHIIPATELAANGSQKSLSSQRTQERLYVQPNLALLPQAFAFEIGKGLLSAIADTHLHSDTFSTLPTRLPWTPFSGSQSWPLGLVPSHALITATATPFFESVPEEFAQVLEVNMGSKVTASLFFEALLSDACTFCRPAHADSGTMEVDISPWYAISSPKKSRERTDGHIRKQVFRMLLSRIPGVEVAQVEDFQYYALVKARSHNLSISSPEHSTDCSRQTQRGSFIQHVGGSQVSVGQDQKRLPGASTENVKACEVQPCSSNAQRLEFGMKLFVPALPEGSLFSIEVLVIVEPGDDKTRDNFLRVYFASPLRHRQTETHGHAVVNPHVMAGVLCGLKQLWKQVAQTLMGICETKIHDVIQSPHQHQLLNHMLQGASEEEMYLLQQSRANANLPTHDQMASKLIEAIAAAYD